jgi:hypothetical protein
VLKNYLSELGKGLLSMPSRRVIESSGDEIGEEEGDEKNGEEIAIDRQRELPAKEIGSHNKDAKPLDSVQNSLVEPLHVKVLFFMSSKQLDNFIVTSQVPKTPLNIPPASEESNRGESSFLTPYSVPSSKVIIYICCCCINFFPGCE